MKKLFLTVSIILILFLGFAAVSAEDNKTVVQDKTFDAIQTAIDNSTESSIIYLEGTYIGSGSTITIEKPVIIEGKDSAVLDAKSSSQIFNIRADGVTLKNLNIINGVVNNPSGINYGGAINAEGDNLKIIGCNFSKSTARYGGALYSQGENVSIINCRFSQNTAEYSGGAFELDGANNYVDNCIFKENVGYHAGGEVAWVGINGILKNSVFNSISDTSKASQFGGAVVWMASNGTVMRSVFNGYHAKKYGSSIYWGGDNGTVSYSIFNSTTPYWGNPDYAMDNYWGLNIDFFDEFTSSQLIYWNGNYTYAGRWVNIIENGGYVNFTSNDGTPLSDYLPEYKLNSEVTIANNTFRYPVKTKIVASNLITYSLYDGKTLKVALKDSVNNAVALKTIKIKLNDITYTRKTNSNGIVSLKISLKTPKTYTATVVFTGDKEYKAISKKVKITVKKQKPVLTQKTKSMKLKTKNKVIKFVLKNQFKKALSKKTVKLTINKKTYSAKTNSKGIISFKVKLTAKKNYSAAVKFAGSSYYDSISKKVSVKVR